MNTTKKTIAIVLAVILSLGLCACASDTEKTSQNRNTIEYVNGTKEHIMFSEITDAYKNRGREYNEKYEGAILSGGGTISTIDTYVAVSQGNVPIKWDIVIYLDNGTRIYYQVTDPEVDLYTGDNVLFYGRITDANESFPYVDVGNWYKDGFVKRT